MLSPLLKVSDRYYDCVMEAERTGRSGEGSSRAAHTPPQEARRPREMPFSRSTSEQVQAEERPLLLLLAQVEATIEDLQEINGSSPWIPCLSRFAGSLRRGLQL
jgi:hypothetical protein